MVMNGGCPLLAQSGHSIESLASQPSYDCILPSGERGIVMKRSATCVAAVVALSISTLATSAEPKAGVDKLYILNCGEGVAGLHERRDQTARLKLDAT